MPPYRKRIGAAVQEVDVQRTPEPELMEDADQALAYARADFTEPNGRFLDLLATRLAPLPPQGAALDLGCGPADITVRFAASNPGWRVDGLDGSAAMLAHGHRAVAETGLGGRVRLVLGRIPEAELPEPAYDLLFSNSLLHHLPEPELLWRAIRRTGRPGATVFLMDLSRPGSVSEAEALVETWSGDEPPVLKRDFLASLCAAFRPDEVEASLAEAGLRLTVEVVSDRHWIAWGRV